MRAHPYAAASSAIARSVNLRSAIVMAGRILTAPNRKLLRYSGWNNRPGIGASGCPGIPR